ncbi:MAG: DegV family protein [Candidatus Heimdallarchaeaceae archaeon]
MTQMFTMTIKLMVDSTCTIPLDFLIENDIAPFEVQISIDGEYKRDLTEIDLIDFTDSHYLIDPVPTTSLAPPSDALEIFEKAKKDGYSEVLYPFMTTKISNQVNSARSAVKRIKDGIKVQLYSTDYAASSQAVFILYAMEMIENKKSMSEIIDFFDRVKPHIYSIGVSNDFTTLFKTGKIQKNVKMSLVTKLLNLKPISDIPLGEGVVGFGGGIGFKGSIRKILKQIEKVTDPQIKYDMLITHSNDLAKAEFMNKAVRKVRTIENEKVWLIPPSVVCSIGKGAVLLTLYPNYEHFKK